MNKNIFIFDELLLGGAAIAALKAMKKPPKKLDGKHALEHLDKAIDMHRKHMSGELPTTDASQEKMMKEMIEARYALAKVKKKNPVSSLKRVLSR